MQIKTTVPVPLHTQQGAYIKKKTNKKTTQVLGRRQRNGTHIGWWDCKLAQFLGKTVGQLKKLNIKLPYGTAIPFLCGYPKKLKVGTQIDIYTPIFTAA